MPVIEAHNLYKTFRICRGRTRSLKALALSFRRQEYEELEALAGVDLVVEPGETVAVIGRNGSGKSTLLRILGNVYHPTRGKVVVRGRVSTLLDLGAGFHPDLTGIENIYLNGTILGLRNHQINEKLQEIIDFSELERFMDTPLRTYSSGMVMRLGFSIAVQVDPDILLVDEVLAVGDETFQHKCYDKIQEFQAAGKTILFVTHDLEAARRVASRAIWISDGRIKIDDGVEETLAAYLQSA